MYYIKYILIINIRFCSGTTKTINIQYIYLCFFVCLFLSYLSDVFLITKRKERQWVGISLSYEWNQRDLTCAHTAMAHVAWLWRFEYGMILHHHKKQTLKSYSISLNQKCTALEGGGFNTSMLSNNSWQWLYFQSMFFKLFLLCWSRK